MWFYIVWFRVDWTVQRPLMADQRFPLEKFSALYIDRNWNLSDEGRCFVSTQYCIFYYLSLSRIVNSSWPLLLDGLIDVHPISQENSFLTYLNAIPIQCRSAWLDHILTWSSPFFFPTLDLWFNHHASISSVILPRDRLVPLCAVHWNPIFLRSLDLQSLMSSQGLFRQIPWFRIMFRQEKIQ